MSTKVDRALYGPSWAEIIIGALLSVIIGALLGVAVLVFKPVIKAAEIPKDAPNGQIYYLPGTGATSSQDNVAKKQKAFVAGEPVVFDEGDLNTMFTPPEIKNAKPSAKPTAPDKVLSLGAPDFKIKNNEMQVAAPLTISLYGGFTSVIVQAKGTFEKEDGVYTFVPTSILVGSLPLDRVPFAQHLLKKKLEMAAAIPPDFTAAWDKLSEVGLQGGGLKTVPAAH